MSNSPTESGKPLYVNRRVISDEFPPGQDWTTCALVFMNRVRHNGSVDMPKSLHCIAKFSLRCLTTRIDFMPYIWNHTLFGVVAIYIHWRKGNVEKEQVLSGQLIQRSSRLPLMDHDTFLTYTKPCRQKALPGLLHRFKTLCYQHSALGTHLPLLIHAVFACTVRKHLGVWFTPSLKAGSELSTT